MCQQHFAENYFRRRCLCSSVKMRFCWQTSELQIETLDFHRFISMIILEGAFSKIYHEISSTPLLKVEASSGQLTVEWYLWCLTQDCGRGHWSTGPDSTIHTAPVRADCAVELCNIPTRAANDSSVFTIKEKATTRAFYWLKVPTSIFTFKTLFKTLARTPSQRS